jgi:TonB family protein
MRSRPRLAFVAFFALTFCLAEELAAQQPTTGTAISADGYPNTSEGLKQLIASILQSAREGNSARETALIHSLVLPADSTWFTEEYGPGFGASLESAYRRVAPDLERQIKSVYEGNVERGWMTPTVLRYTDPESVNSPVDHFLNCMDQIVPLYQTAFHGNSPSLQFSLKPGERGNYGAGDLDGYFVYDRNAFRFIPMGIFMKLPHERPVRIKLNLDVMASKIILSLPVEIPPDAIKKHIPGRVLVQVVLDAGGNIKDLKPLEGNPILSAAVVDSVKQWRFAPTKLDGDPVEVEFEIPYEFQIR